MKQKYKSEISELRDCNTSEDNTTAKINNVYGPIKTKFKIALNTYINKCHDKMGFIRKTKCIEAENNIESSDDDELKRLYENVQIIPKDDIHHLTTINNIILSIETSRNLELANTWKNYCSEDNTDDSTNKYVSICKYIDAKYNHLRDIEWNDYKAFSLSYNY